MTTRESILRGPRVLLPLSCVVLLGIFSECGKRQEADSAPDAIVSVRTATVKTGRIDETIVVSGTTKYRMEAQIRTPIAGLLTHFTLYNGDKVKKGELVARIRTKESQASISGAEQLLRSATTASQREEAQKSLDLATKTVNTVDITSSSDGILSDKAKNEQEVVAEGELIATIVDPSSLLFLAQVTPSSMSRIRLGQQVMMKFTTRPGKTYTGVVHRIQPVANPGDQSIPVQVTFTTPNTDLEGSLFGEATITVGEHRNILLVPKPALLKNDENNTASLMIVGTDSLAHAIEVQTGLATDSTVEVSSPLLSGASVVITEGQYGLPDSTRVRILR
jgi:multidrug efflux pump subunit AcrA (membrane-fusion protein)